MVKVAPFTLTAPPLASAPPQKLLYHPPYPTITLSIIELILESENLIKFQLPTVRNRNRICDRIKEMMWVITKRGIIRRLNQLRWKPRMKGRELTFTYDDYKMKTRGVEWKKFSNELFKEEFYINKFVRFLSHITAKIRGGYVENFPYKLDDVISKCIADGYVYKSTDNFLTVTSRGEDLVSFWYYPKKLINQPVIIRIIEILIIFALGFITANYFNK